MGEDLILEEGGTYLFKNDTCKNFFLSTSLYNKEVVEDWYKEGFTLCSVEDNEGWIGDVCVIQEDEIKYFKKKETLLDGEYTCEDYIYWDGISDLEVGIIVGRNCSGKTPFQIKYVGQEYCIVNDVSTGKEHSIQLKNLMSLKKTDKEETFDKVLAAWHSTGIDFAYDGRGSYVKLEDFFEVMYSVMRDSD